LPPLECCFGTSPIQAEKFRAERKALGSGTLATGKLIEPPARLIGSMPSHDPAVEL
jgi:hypothetical protein